jgi:SAM-dependent methyltransferase
MFAMTAWLASRWAPLIALLAGLALPLAFAPFHLWPLAVVSPAVLFVIAQAAPQRRALISGYLYGLGYFGFGCYWVYHSIAQYGGGPVAAIFVTPLFALAIALYPLLTIYLARRLRPHGTAAALWLVFPACWILVEWLRKCVEKGHEQSRQRPLRILNVGCGPAVELQQLLRREPALADCEITLIDFSEETLNYAREQLETAMTESGIRPDIQYVQESVHGLLRRATKGDDGASDSHYDVLYCAGLFDYLSDRICSRLLNLFHQWCAPGGEILATNVHPSNPARNWMEHLLEWYLIYRDEAGMEKLGAPFADHRIFRDSTGINIFLKILKPQGGHS